jgi:hypothetical protein
MYIYITLIISTVQRRKPRLGNLLYYVSQFYILNAIFEFLKLQNLNFRFFHTTVWIDHPTFNLIIHLVHRNIYNFET